MPAQRPGIVCTGGIIAGLQGGHIHALMVAGGLVMQYAPGGDWKRVDWDALAAWLDRYGYKVADCETEIGTVKILSQIDLAVSGPVLF